MVRERGATKSLIKSWALFLMARCMVRRQALKLDFFKNYAIDQEKTGEFKNYLKSR